ncbi:LETM1-like protein-domain-containing protein, partial [Piptocephalis cylindrospora]
KPKKSIWLRVKEEVIHYWHGFRLFGIEIRVSSKYLWRMLKGDNLSRREHRQMKRTSKDLVRMVPFLVFLIVPFMELLIPVALKLFPNMLPSTFENSSTREEKRRKLLKVRLETAKFLRETITTDLPAGSGNQEAATAFADFFAGVRTSGKPVNTQELLEVATHFNDELTLDNLSRSQLVSMCRYMGIRVFGPDNFLRFQLRNRVDKLRADDRLISAEGVQALTPAELSHACSSRGIRTIGVSPFRMRQELSGWLELSIDHKVPSSLLILSRAFSLLAEVPASPTDALRATLESLPDELVQEAHLDVSEKEGQATLEQRLRVIEEQEEMIADEAERKKQDEERAKLEAE